MQRQGISSVHVNAKIGRGMRLTREGGPVEADLTNGWHSSDDVLGKSMEEAADTEDKKSMAGSCQLA